MTSQHTPGPWQYMADSLEIVRADDVQPLIATVNIDNTSDEQAIADAHLIAAAPELLAALNDLLSCDGSDHFEEDGFHTLTPHAETVAQCVAAIAKAEGR